MLIFFRQGILDWVMDSTKRDNKEVQEKMMALQKEKDQVRKQAIICINTRAGLFKSWITWFVLLTLIIHWISINLVDSVIQPSNNRGQLYMFN